MTSGKPIKVSQAILDCIEENREHPRETYDDILRRTLKLKSFERRFKNNEKNI